MGVSDGPYFAWLAGALERFERATGALGAVGDLRAAAAPGASVELHVLAGARMNPALERVRDALGRDRTRVTFLDKFERGPDVTPADFNALGAIAPESADMIVMTRASYMIEDPAAFLAGARRILRPGGLLVVDWLHGAADAPLLTLPGHHEYGGRAYASHTTYCDAEFVTEFRDEFGAFIAHVNRPPAWRAIAWPGTSSAGSRWLGYLLGRALAPVSAERSGATVPAMASFSDAGAEDARLGRRSGSDPGRQVTIAAYLATLRADLEGAGKRLIGPADLSPHFKVVFRDVRYLYPRTRKFHLHLLTVLRPAGA